MGQPNVYEDWQSLTKAELDTAYNQAAFAVNREQVLGRYASNSEAVRHKLGVPKRYAYGTARNEALDVFSGGNVGAPINLFVHGGAWRSGRAVDYAFPADLFVSAGAIFVVLDFDWVQDRYGDLFPIADQICRAIAWTWFNAEKIGGDRDRLYVSAHSSGAHMAGVALTSEWTAYGISEDAIKGALLCSGMYDLEPVSLSARNSYVAFTKESMEALSPMRHLACIKTPVVLTHGSLESPEFQRQTRDFGAALADHGAPCISLIGDGYNHFEILETFASPDGLLGRAALEQMALA